MNKFELIVEAASKAFESEAARITHLQGKAEKLMAGVAAVGGYQLHDIEKWSNSTSHVVNSGWLALIFLGLTLALALTSMRVRKYRGYPRGTELLDKLKDKAIADESAGEIIARMLLEAREQNARFNDKRASLITISGVFLVVGFLLAVMSRLAAVLQ